MYLTKAVSANNYVDSLPHAQESPRVLFKLMKEGGKKTESCGQEEMVVYNPEVMWKRCSIR